MAGDVDGDLAVDVLIVGAGIQGLYLAQELASRYSVCGVSGPAVPVSTLDSSGYFSAGYDGTDVNRIQPARRAAGWWRLWAESNDVAFSSEAPWYVVPSDVASGRTGLWTDAMLTAPGADHLPDVFADGSLVGAAPFRAEADL